MRICCIAFDGASLRVRYHFSKRGDEKLIGKLHAHLEKLNHFLEVASQGSLRRAAEKMNLSQPTLSYSIKILEKVTQQSLFMRNSQGVKLTAAGVILLEFCSRYFAELETLETRMRKSAGKEAEPLRIGTRGHLPFHFWPQFLNYFYLRFPDMPLALATASNADLKSMLLQNKMDCAVAIEISDHQGLESFVLCEEYFAFYVSPQSRFVLQTCGQIENHFKISKNVFPSIYVPHALTAGNISLKRLLVEAGLSSHSCCFELENFEAVMAFALQGLGVAVLPIQFAAHAVKDRALVRIQVDCFNAEGFGRHRIMASARKGNEGQAAVGAFVAELQNFTSSQKFVSLITA